MPSPNSLAVTFRGVRGSRPTPVATHLEYGGNTTCLEIGSGAGDRLIIDAGSGMSHIDPTPYASRFHVLLTHFHSDHIQGLPFFRPLFEHGCELTFLAGTAPEAIGRFLEGQMVEPYSPALAFVAARRHYQQIDERAFAHGSITVHPFPLNHPQGAWGYRMESGGAAIVHASDHEHGDPKLDRILRAHSENADVLIYDAQHTDKEFQSKRGWGHSTWSEAARVARDARVKRLILFHHDPLHDDATMRAIEHEARQHFENTDAAREGTTLRL